MSVTMSHLAAFKPHLKRAIQWYSGPKPVFYLLLYFMGLLIAGTIAQKYMGLFPATHMFFNAFLVWYGPIPFPAGATILCVLFGNLLLHFVRYSAWNLTQLGTTLAHLSILVLLFGGAVTLFDKQEGFMILQQDTPQQKNYDYHQRYLTVERNGIQVVHKPHHALASHKQLDGTPFRVTSLCRNCTLDDAGTLQTQDARLDDEMNQMAVTLQTQDGVTFVLTEFLTPNATHSIRNDNYTLRFERKAHPLPFALSLQNLTQSFYAGTAIAQEYASDIDIIESGYTWPVHIAMNKPFRYKGYTFYQSSVLGLGNGQTASVLNVVKNSGWFFPYISSALLFIGLGLHAWMRRHGRI